MGLYHWHRGNRCRRVGFGVYVAYGCWCRRRRHNHSGGAIYDLYGVNQTIKTAQVDKMRIKNDYFKCVKDCLVKGQIDPAAAAPEIREYLKINGLNF
jgi:hypothetical protein